MPSAASSTVTGTVPAGVAKTSSPGPSRSASATAVATVAWPQKDTSASGLKKRRVNARPGSPSLSASPSPSGGAVRKAVSL
ncbi:hypothetical protein GCM10020000_57710 [Streptomyces olivoverticillatus]